MFLLLYRNYLLEYVPMHRVRTGDCRRAGGLGPGPSSDTGFTTCPWLSHLSAWMLFVEFGVFLAGKWVCFPGDWEEAHGDAGGGRKQGFAD